MFRRSAAAALTGPLAFLLSGAIDVAAGLVLALAYLARSRARRRLRPGTRRRGGDRR